MLRDYLELPLSVRILCLGSLINRAGSFVLIFLTIYASEQLGFGVSFAATCVGALGLGSMVGSMLGGQLADRIGRKPVMLMALLGGAALLVLLSEIENRWLFMGTIAMFALVSDMYRPAAQAMIADVVSVEQRPHAFALMYISINLGFAVAPPLGGLLAEISFSWLFLGDALTMVMYGILIVALIRETRAPRSHQQDSTPQVEASGAASRMLGDIPFLLFCASTLLIAIVFMQGMSTLPIFIRQSGCSKLEFGLLMSLNGAMIFVLQLPLTHWLGRYNAMSVVLVGGILVAVGFGLNALGSSLGFVAFTIAVWTLGEILQAPFTQTIVTSLAPADLRARYLGLFGMCYSSALTIGAPIGGSVLDRYGPAVLWTGSFLVAMLAIVIYAVIHPTITRRTAMPRGATAPSTGLAISGQVKTRSRSTTPTRQTLRQSAVGDAQPSGDPSSDPATRPHRADPG